MKKRVWIATIMLFLIVANVTLVVVFYDTLFGGSSKNSTVVTSKDDKIIQTTDKHPLEHLEINQKISNEFNEYILTDYKSKSTMNVMIDKIIVSKQGEDIVVNGIIKNDSNIELQWILMHINLYNDAGRKLDYIPYTVIYAENGDKPLKLGESINISHVFEDALKIVSDANEWNGSFTIDVLTTK
ncbi:hypothetical protein [Paenibacillus barengoltzii]|uniref:hypothetical protein n=1 Tax=Paenibacillus barengoltzii TaxID=343517 RepID=UPI000FDA0543|nr:hypothetical protein [Paenibacillus barengoltzii]